MNLCVPARKALLAAALLFLSLATAGLAPAAEQSDQPLTIVFHGDLTGPVGFWNAPRIVGIQDAIDYMNSETGGIAGRPVRLEWRDHKSNAGLAEKNYQELKEFKAVVWHSCGTGEQQLLKHLYEQDKSQVLLTCSTSPGVTYPVGHVFGTAPYYPDQVGFFLDWLVDNWDRKGAGRMPRLAIMTYNSGYGRSCLTKEVLEYAKKKGVEIVDIIYIPYVTTDALGPLQRAQKAGADWVFGQWLWQTVPPYLKANQEHKLGLKFAVNSFGVDEVMIIKGEEAAEGLTGVSSWSLPSESTPGTRLVQKTLAQKFRRPEDRGSSYYLGWMNMWQTKQALEQTLARVKSWDKVTPAEVITTMETWRDVDINGLGRVNYSPTMRCPNVMRIVQVKGGKWVPVTDWSKAPNLVPPEWQKAGGN